tara:strand:+ start:394 stop:504 length:111 start_codon:yes stop_codon:yes gene_type:complete
MEPVDYEPDYVFIELEEGDGIIIDRPELLEDDEDGD